MIYMGGITAVSFQHVVQARCRVNMSGCLASASMHGFVYNDIVLCVVVCLFFFFQAEDGIRDHCVTGVQTCALPISDGASVNALLSSLRAGNPQPAAPARTTVNIVGTGGGPSTFNLSTASAFVAARSEERRVGKECRWRAGAATQQVQQRAARASDRT